MPLSTRLTKRDVRECLFALFLCTVGDLITGLVMGHSSSIFLLVPALIILIPPSAGLRGNIFSSLGSRLSSYLHAGRLPARLKSNPLLSENVMSALFLLMFFGIVDGIAASVIAVFLGLNRNFLTTAVNLILVAEITAFISAGILIPATVLLAIGSFKWGWNPDHTTIPIVTLFGDMITLPVLFAATLLVVKVGFDEKVIIVAFIFILLLLVFSSVRSGRFGVGKKIVIESIPILALCVALDFGSGTILGSKLDKFIATAGLLTLVPAFLEDGGAMGGILAARFTSQLHVGLLEPKAKPDNDVFYTFAVMHAIAAFTFTLVGVFGYTVNILLHIPTISLPKMVLVTLVAGQLIMVIIDAMAYYFSILSFKKGVDPDNVGIPIIASFMDVAGTACYVFALKILGII